MMEFEAKSHVDATPTTPTLTLTLTLKAFLPLLCYVVPPSVFIMSLSLSPIAEESAQAVKILAIAAVDGALFFSRAVSQLADIAIANISSQTGYFNTFPLR
jgi:hypothetical protein